MSRSASGSGRRCRGGSRGARATSRGRVGEVVATGGLDRRDRRPAHAEVALDRAGHRRGGDDLTGQAAVLRVELDDAVHVGGRTADVDDDDVAGPAVLRRRGPRASSSTPVSTTSGVAPRTMSVKVRPRASVRLLRCLPPMTWLRKISRIARRGAVGREHADAGHHVVGQHVRRPRARRAAIATAAATRRCRPPRRAPARRHAPGSRASPSSTSALPPSVPPTSSTTSGSAARRSASLVVVETARAAPATTLPPLESATRRPASAVTSSSLPTTAMRSPPPALEQASTSASDRARVLLDERAPGRRRTRRARHPRRSASGSVVGWLAVARSVTGRRSTSAALVKVDPKSTQTTDAHTSTVRSATATMIAIRTARPTRCDGRARGGGRVPVADRPARPGGSGCQPTPRRDDRGGEQQHDAEGDAGPRTPRSGGRRRPRPRPEPIAVRS